MSSPSSRLWTEISTSRWRENYRAIAEVVSPLPVMPVIKANAYGTGDRVCALAFREAGARCFAVSCVSEGIRLHDLADWVLILGSSLPEEIPEVVEAGLVPSVSDPATCERISLEAVSRGRTVSVHMKVDTGMGRFGFAPRDAVRAGCRIAALPGVRLDGVFSHFPVSGRRDEGTLAQIAQLRGVYEGLAAAGVQVRWCHIANSTAIAGIPESWAPPFNLVRSGIDLHGGHLGVTPRPYRTHPVLTLKARLLSVREMAFGTTVGYGRTYRVSAPAGERIGVVSIGYADGYPRCLSNLGSMLVRGHRCPIRGIICMDYTMVSLDAVPDAVAGDEVVVIGCQGEASVSLAEVARAAETIPYELMCCLGNRVERRYL